MNSAIDQVWFLIGYVRTVPGARTFVFPIVQNGDVAVGRAYYSLNGSTLDFIEPDLHEEVIRITPIEIPDTSRLQDALPLYGYEFNPGRVWFGDACELSKALIEFSCKNEILTKGERREITGFVERVIEKNEYVAKNTMLLLGQATISENRSSTMFDDSPEHLRTTIIVLGVGNGGCNSVESMIKDGVGEVVYICADTDSQTLARSSAHKIIQLGSAGLGTGGIPEIGRDMAEVAEADIRDAIQGAHMLFITAGMGGGTGTGAAPIIARVAKEMGILTVGVVTMPFAFEGGRRMAIANVGLAELEANVDSLIVVLNEKLLDTQSDDVSQKAAFAQTNDVLKNAVGGIAEIINVPGHVNVDFEDVRTIMREPGMAMIGTGSAKGPDRARIAAEQAAACPLLDGINLSSAKGVLMLITAAKGSLKLSESKLAMNTVRAVASPSAHVIYGTANNDKLGDEIHVTVLATGISRNDHRGQASTQVVRTPELHTGIDNMPLHVSRYSNYGVPSISQLDFAGMATPRVWRTHRPDAVDRVDELSSREMDDYELPAFLRKNHD